MYHGIYRLKPYKDIQLAVFAKWLCSKHISANTITCSGLVFGLLAAVWLCAGQIILGLSFIILSVFADVLDGTVARISRRVSFRSKLFDSISDRIVETALVGALIYIGSLPWWGLVLPLGSVMLLLNRFWGYHLHLDTSFIVIARFERMVAILGAVIIPWRWLTLFLYAIVALGTLVANFSIVKAIFNMRKGHYRTLRYFGHSRPGSSQPL